MVFAWTIYFWYRYIRFDWNHHQKNSSLLQVQEDKYEHENQIHEESRMTTISTVSSAPAVSTRLPSTAWTTNTDLNTQFLSSSSRNQPIKMDTITKTYWEEMKSPSFIILTCIYSIHCSRINFVLTTSREFLRYLGDDATGNQYISILSWSSPLALLGLPLVDWILETYGYGVGLQCINFIAILHGIVLCYFDLKMQIIGFLLLALYHCFLFGIVFSFLGVLVGNHVIGKLSGIVSAVGGIVQLINVPFELFKARPKTPDVCSFKIEIHS